MVSLVKLHAYGIKILSGIVINIEKMNHVNDGYLKWN